MEHIDNAQGNNLLNASHLDLLEAKKRNAAGRQLLGEAMIRDAAIGSITFKHSAITTACVIALANGWEAHAIYEPQRPKGESSSDRELAAQDLAMAVLSSDMCYLGYLASRQEAVDFSGDESSTETATEPVADPPLNQWPTTRAEELEQTEKWRADLDCSWSAGVSFVLESMDPELASSVAANILGTTTELPPVMASKIAAFLRAEAPKDPDGGAESAGDVGKNPDGTEFKGMADGGDANDDVTSDSKPDDKAAGKAAKPGKAGKAS